jgi:hypothetical protein
MLSLAGVISVFGIPRTADAVVGFPHKLSTLPYCHINDLPWRSEIDEFIDS